MPTARLTLVAHTHWDREWYEPFETFRSRLVVVLDEAIELLERDPRLTFTLDGHVALVDDYLEVRPQQEPRIRALNAAGRLHIGPWYTQADTLLVDGESLVRNLALGIRRAEELGGAMRVGYMADQFGHAAQVPQLLRTFGIESAVMWRGVGPERPPHAFSWIGPDGSAVTTLWLQDGYATGRRLPSDPQGFAEAIDRSLDRLAGWLGEVPLAVPVGDDHVRLASWLPDAAAALRARRPDLKVELGGYHDHLAHVAKGAADHVVRGELRSPAFSPVLAAVASARIREKQAAARAIVLLQRYAEPLAAWAQLAGREPPRQLIERAWKQLVLNQAHDSIAGCGIDASHDDVKGRYRWAEQLATTARDQALAQIRVEPADAIAFHPGPRAPALTIEAAVPRALGNQLVALGPDGVARPVQALGCADEAPLFEGEFASAELSQYLGGLDPATPIFGKYLVGITTSPDGPGRIRLDVGLGETPVGPGALVEDQKRVAAMLHEVERFRVVLHGGGTTRQVLLQAGAAPEAGFLPITVRAGEPAPGFAAAGATDGETVGITSGSITVTAEPDGTVLVTDLSTGLAPVRANDLVDDGDRGDLYHFDPAGTPVRARASRARVVERGPLRARLVVEQDFDLPVSVSPDRSGRSPITRATTITTEVTLTAGERRVELTTTFYNEVADHRLRALFHVPIHAERLDVDHGLAVVARPFDTASLGAGSERPAPTGQHHHFVDVSDGKTGAAIMSRGLPEHEVVRERDGRSTAVALTLVRAVGWLSRGDLKCIDHAAGPMVPTPSAQEPGAHRFEYALVLHKGNWEEAAVHADARRFAAPALALPPKGRAPVPAARSLVEIGPAQVVLSAVHPSAAGRGLVVRVLNAGHAQVQATLRPAMEPREAIEVDPLERPVEQPRCAASLRGDVVHLTLGPWQLATILMR